MTIPTVRGRSNLCDPKHVSDHLNAAHESAKEAKQDPAGHVERRRLRPGKQTLDQGGSSRREETRSRRRPRVSLRLSDRRVRGGGLCDRCGLAADRGKQLSAASGKIVPYTSGRIYASAKGDELIAIFDEPPAAGKVLGIWRILRLPRGSTDPAGLKAALTERYGEPNTVTEVSLPFMTTGLAYLWAGLGHGGCHPVYFDFQTDVWLDE